MDNKQHPELKPGDSVLMPYGNGEGKVLEHRVKYEYLMELKDKTRQWWSEQQLMEKDE
jgi:hypothetical protein